MKKTKTPLVSVIMGSDSDYQVMRGAIDALKDFGISYEKKVISAHRTPKEMVLYAVSARRRGVRIIIAGAGGAAHLPGMVAANTELPVIGVPVAVGPLEGQDALLSIAQMPKGVPVATVAIGGAYNAGILAVQMLGISESKILDRVASYKEKLRRVVLKKKLPR